MALKCQECGAPLKGEIEDGYVVCEYCGTINLVGPALRASRTPPASPQKHPIKRPPLRRKHPLLGILRELEQRGIIPKNEFRKYTLQAIRAGRRPRVAVLIAIRRLVREGKIDRKRLHDELVHMGIHPRRMAELL